MLENTLIDKILAMPDSEVGGDNALDGFEFQVSAAIYLVFEELRNKEQFTLVYEKLEDFIIFTDKINLYQAKSINRNITPNVLYSSKKPTKKDGSKLSIIEKMQNNYTAVTNLVSSCPVQNNLLVCENIEFSKKLHDVPDIKSRRVLSFSDLTSEVKNEIVKNTAQNNYDWDRISAIRLIPKKRHEEITRVYIEDVIRDLIGENKINSLALYNSMTDEIRKIRKQKTGLSQDYIMSEIMKFASFEEDFEFKDYTHLLSAIDRRNFQINHYFKQIQGYLKIPNHPIHQDYLCVLAYCKKNIARLSNFDEIYKAVYTLSTFKQLRIRLEDAEIKALILHVVVKELG